jgi:hypothetical protein
MGETEDRAARFAAEMAAAEFEDADEQSLRFFVQMAEALAQKAQKARKSRAWQPLDPPKKKPGRKPIGDKAMNSTERTRRRRGKNKLRSAQERARASKVPAQERAPGERAKAIELEHTPVGDAVIPSPRPPAGAAGVSSPCEWVNGFRWNALRKATLKAAR